MEEIQNQVIGEGVATPAKSPKKLEEEKIARRRFYYLLVGVAVIFAALIVWEIVELFI